jgi:hypothetical protein
MRAWHSPVSQQLTLCARKCAKFVEGKKSAMGDKAPDKPEKFLALDLRKNALLVGGVIAGNSKTDTLAPLQENGA